MNRLTEETMMSCVGILRIKYGPENTHIHTSVFITMFQGVENVIFTQSIFQSNFYRPGFPIPS